MIDDLTFLRESCPDHRPADVERLVAALAPPALAPRAEARRRLLGAATSARGRFLPFVGRLAELFDLTRERVETVLGGLEDPSSWQVLLPGTALHHLDGGPRVAHADCGFARYDAGAVFPEHEHLGTETTLVLEGVLLDSDGSRYGPGDWLVLEAGTRHSFRAPEGPLVFAVVLEGGITMGGRRVDVGKPR